MTHGLPIPEASAHLGDLVRRARVDGEHVILTEGDEPVAAVISIEELRALQHAEDAADIAECLRSQADPGPRFTHEEVLALLEADAEAEADATGA